MTWVFSTETKDSGPYVTKAEAASMLDTMQEVAESTATRYKLILADMLYESRMLPAANWRTLQQIAKRGGVEPSADPRDYARSPSAPDGNPRDDSADDLLDRIMGLFAPASKETPGEDVVYTWHPAFHEMHLPRQDADCWYCLRWQQWLDYKEPQP